MIPAARGVGTAGQSTPRTALWNENNVTLCVRQVYGSGKIAPMRWRAVCKLARQLPEVVEGETYGVPALSVRGSLVARLLPDKKSIAVKVGLAERAAMCASRPETFVVTPEFQNYSMMIVRLTTIGAGEIWPVLVDSWRRSAPPRLVADHDGRLRGDV